MGSTSPRSLWARPATVRARQHDLYIEVRGPSATDVHHNFVQRWNEASERAEEDGVWPPGTGSAALFFPSRISAPCGPSVVQIQRMVCPGRYADRTATPGGQPFDIAAGERSILEQYRMAIDAARTTIMIENQALPISEIANQLEAALKRGVEVALLVPATPEEHVRSARRTPTKEALFAGIEALGRHENFLLAGLVAPEGESRRSIYVHAKAMLVDDAWGDGRLVQPAFELPLRPHRDERFGVGRGRCARAAMPPVAGASGGGHEPPERSRIAAALSRGRPRERPQEAGRKLRSAGPRCGPGTYDLRPLTSLGIPHGTGAGQVQGTAWIGSLRYNL